MAPLRVINAVAPTRVCDNGGWTDTWFARHGKVFNIAVDPAVEVQVEVHPRDDLERRVVLNAENFGEQYSFTPGEPLPDRHPLLEAAVDELGVPDHVAVRITIHCATPPGASTGTSGAVGVALVAALDALTPGRLAAHEVAREAHRIEVERLGLQSGVQDQLCSAYGGLCYIDVFDYPNASVSRLDVPARFWWELERRLLLVFLGRAHGSSSVHERVIGALREAGPDAEPLCALRQLAERSRDAVAAGDLWALGRAMSENTAVQRTLHPDLVGAEAQAVIDAAKRAGALGWKVNGAGGEGGSVTILTGHDVAEKRRLARALAGIDDLFQAIPVRLSPTGVRVWESPLRA